jgi:hypothetical protein
MFSLNVFCREFLSRPPMENFVDDCKFAAADLSPVVFIFRLLQKTSKRENVKYIVDKIVNTSDIFRLSQTLHKQKNYN